MQQEKTSPPDKIRLEKELTGLISKELQRIRRERCLTLENMADQTGLDYTSFYRIYSGINLPKLITLLQISKTYFIPMEYWFKEVENFAPARKLRLKQNRANLELLHTINKLDDAARTVIIKMLKSYVQKMKIK
jgi:transcriptional regulator with XRE-family HTH domain